MLLGPRQCGKTTLARQFVGPDSANYFDLEDPAVRVLLEEPMTALGSARGLVVIDEAQREPGLFPVLRVLVDREDAQASFLILGSASPALSRQASESLAGRVEIIDMRGFDLTETPPDTHEDLWLRGGSFGCPRAACHVDTRALAKLRAAATLADPCSRSVGRGVLRIHAGCSSNTAAPVAVERGMPITVCRAPPGLRTP